MIGSSSKDSLREGYTTNAISIVNAHLNQGHVTRGNQVLVIAVFSLESSCWLAILLDISLKRAK